MSNPEEVAKAFVNHYVGTFDTNVDALATLFQPQSMMTFEGEGFQGPQAILEKLKRVGQVKHQVKSTDVQPSLNGDSMLIFVTGSVQISGGNPLHYCEMFQLVSTGPGAYYVHNCIFRLNYGL